VDFSGGTAPPPPPPPARITPTEVKVAPDIVGGVAVCAVVSVVPEQVVGYVYVTDWFDSVATDTLAEPLT
jgi:hypothetical protein